MKKYVTVIGMIGVLFLISCGLFVIFYAFNESGAIRDILIGIGMIFSGVFIGGLVFYMYDRDQDADRIKKYYEEIKSEIEEYRNGQGGIT